MGQYGQEEHNMSSEIFSPKPSDNLGNKGYFPETARKLPPTLPELPPMPKPPIEFPKQPETNPQPESSRKALYVRLAGALLAIAATGGPATAHHIQNESAITPDAIGRDIASIPGFYWNVGKGAIEDIERLIGIKQKEAILPYDTSKTEIQTITAGINAKSITDLTQEEIVSIFNDAISLQVAAKDQTIPPDAGKNNVKILLPAKLEDGKTVKLSARVQDADLTVKKNPDDKGTHYKVKMFGGEDVFYDKNTEIPLFVDNAEIFQFPPNIVNGRSYFGGLAVRQTLPDGSMLVFKVLATSDIRDIEPADIIRNAPIVAPSSRQETPDAPSYFKAKNGIPLKITTENGKISIPTILKTTRDGSHVTIFPVSDRYANVSLSIYTEENRKNSTTNVLYAPKTP